MNNPLILMDFDSDVSISLPGNGTWLHEVDRLILVQVVTTLSCAYPWNHLIHLVDGAGYFLLPSDGVVVELSALLLELIVTHVESVSAKRVSHSHIVVGLAGLGS